MEKYETLIYKDPSLHCPYAYRKYKRRNNGFMDYRCLNYFVFQEFEPLHDWVIRCPNPWKGCPYVIEHKKYNTLFKKMLVACSLRTKRNLLVSLFNIVRYLSKRGIDPKTNKELIMYMLGRFKFEKMSKVPKSLKKRGNIWFIKKRKRT